MTRSQQELIDELADTLRDVGNVLVGYARDFGQVGTAGNGKRDAALAHADRLFEQYYRLRPEARP
jgi:hypothetical protein